MKISRTQWSQLSILYKIIARGESPTPSEYLEIKVARLFHDKKLRKSATAAALEFARDLQLFCLESVKNGELLHIFTINYPISGRRMQKKYQKLVNFALKDLQTLDFHVASLYERKPFFQDFKVILSFEHESEHQEFLKTLKNFQKSANLTRYTCPLRARKDPTKEVRFLLNYIFRFPDFRPAQIDGILKILQNEDTIALLPTGSGKSIIFQLLAFIRPGAAIVVCPIISLIDDQVDNLHRKGITRVAGISATTEDKPQALLNILRGHTIITYVAPERFQIYNFREQLKTYAQDSTFSIIAIDEAHCVSEWGHDFRTSYLGLAPICREICQSQPLIALTGTASQQVLDEMRQDLQMPTKAILTPPTFDRPELHYEVLAAPAAKKPQVLEHILTELLPARFQLTPEQFYQLNGANTMSGIIFCPHVSGEYGVTTVTEQLKTLGLTATEYYGQQSRVTKQITDDDWAQQKVENATKFKNNQVPLLVATKSFGMGVDKPNIRYTIHYAPPSSLEAYYQEAGRAGRDRQTAYSYVIISPEDKQTLQFFHDNGFPGLESELETTIKVLTQLGDLTRPRLVNLRPTTQKQSQCEKAIHRLRTLGVIRDYTVNFASGEFNVELAKLTKSQILALPQDLANLLAETYAILEPARRHAYEYVLQTFTDVATLETPAQRDAAIRQAIIKYLAIK